LRWQIRAIPDRYRILTMELVSRLRVELNDKIKALQDTMEVKLAGEHVLKELKFSKVEQRFELNERQRQEMKQDGDRALAQTLTAVKELNAEKDKNHEKIIEAQAALLASYKENSEAKIDDLKD
jgi:hypothetical protein